MFDRKKKTPPRSLQLFVEKNMPFAYVEAYKSLRTNLKFIASAANAKSFVITSAYPQESKSNVSINIATALAAEGKKVVLVDCDLRKPILHRYLRIKHNHTGLTYVLSGEKDLYESIINFTDINISVLTSGAVPPNPSELLAQDRMKNVIKQLEKDFDYVLLDAPPVSVVTDAAVLGTMVDGALLVVRSKFAPLEAVKLAKKKFDDVNVKIYGVILSRFNMKDSTKRSGYSYSYEYDGYGTHENN